MENIQALIETKERELEIAKETAKSNYNKFYDVVDQYKAKIVEAISKYLVEDAIIVRANLQYPGWSGELDFHCEIGFQDKSRGEGWLVFGCDFDFYYENGKIAINKGTMGKYGLEDEYQIKRDAVVYNLVYLNGKKLTEELNAIEVPELREVYDVYAKSDRLADTIKYDLRKLKREAIAQSIIVNNVYAYTENASSHSKVSNKTIYNWKEDVFTITKITDKYIWFDVETTGWVNESKITIKDKCKKELFISLISDNSIKEITK